MSSSCSIHLDPFGYTRAFLLLPQSLHSFHENINYHLKGYYNKIMAKKRHKKTACCSEELCAPSQSLLVCAPLTQWLSSRGGANSWNLAFFFHLLKLTHTWQPPSPASFITRFASNFSLGSFISSRFKHCTAHFNKPFSMVFVQCHRLFVHNPN